MITHFYPLEDAKNGCQGGWVSQKVQERKSEKQKNTPMSVINGQIFSILSLPLSLSLSLRPLTLLKGQGEVNREKKKSSILILTLHEDEDEDECSKLNV